MVIKYLKRYFIVILNAVKNLLLHLRWIASLVQH